MSELKARIQEDVKTAMKAQDKPRLNTLRLMTAALKQKEVDERIVLTDANVIEILNKMLKQRQESIEQYRNGGREDLVAQEQFEIEVIKTYMPTALSDAEVSALLEAAIAEAGASSAKDMGKVMNILRPQIQGRTDMKVVSELVKQRLS